MQVKFLFGYYILKNHKSKFLSPEIVEKKIAR